MPPGTTDADIDCAEAWDIETGESEIIVAVLDTGIDYNHRDLAANIWNNIAELNGVAGVDDDGKGYIDDFHGYNFVSDNGNPKDDRGHGTHCAGIIAAEGNNGVDIAGVCWRAKIMGLKVLDTTGHGDTSYAAMAIYYAVNNGADVLSNSWGGDYYSQALKDAVDYAYSQGVVVVAAAGNNNNTKIQYPAYYDHVISVAATDSDDNRASFSTYGSWVDIAAPGVDILSLRANGTLMGLAYDSYTTIMSGTSMACPHVAGASALLLSIDSDISADDLEAALKASADPIAPEICQSGRLNIDGAINAMVVSKGSVRLDSSVYNCYGKAAVEIRDLDIKGSGTQSLALTSDGGDSETLVLTETDVDTGIFVGQIDISSDPAAIEDGLLQVSHGQIITASYQDADDGTGVASVVTDTADVDCQMPAVTNVEVVELTFRTTKILVETDEPTRVQLRVGQACGGPYTIIKNDYALSAVHTIELSQLLSQTDYYFVVEVADAAGNASTDDNGGVCYSFTTPEFLGLRVPSVYPTIQSAVDAAIDGDEIIIEDGIFTGPGNYDIDCGALEITIRSENGPDNCIIDCQGLGRGFNFHGYVQDVPAAVIDGITITNGNAVCGGGVSFDFITNKTHIPLIRNCVIKNCYADEMGAGVYIRGGIRLKIDNCELSHNDGDAIYADGDIVYVSNCKIRLNSGCGTNIYLGDEGTSVISGCVISGNGGSGMYSFMSNIDISNCSIANNKLSGIHLYNYDEKFTASDCLITRNGASGINTGGEGATIKNCIIADNYSANDGGGIRSEYGDDLVVRNCVIAGNHASMTGGGIYSNQLFDKTEAHYVNCTIINNTAGEMGGGLSLGSYTVNISNCIIVDNICENGPQIAVRSAACDSNISYSNVESGALGIYYKYPGRLRWGTGIIDAEAQFALSGDYHFLSGSACIDSGTNTPPGGLQLTDLYGRSRIMDGDNNGSSVADMGAYEFEYASSIPVIAIDREFFEFYSFNGQPNPEPQFLSIRNALGGTLNWQITDDSFWLETNPQSGTSTGQVEQVEIKVDTTTLSHGEYAGIISISDPNAVNGVRTVFVKLHIADQVRVPEDYPNIQAAIDALGDGSTVVVSDGTYTGVGNLDINFRGKAITVKSKNGSANCIVDCQGYGRGFIFDTYEENDSILDGFTITNGYNSLLGGAIYCKESSPTIMNCEISNSQSDKWGGGVCFQNSWAKMVRCTVKGNVSDGDGGGVFCWRGGSVTIDSCTVTNNTADEEGGGMALVNDNNAVVANCLITNNTAGTLGGGVFIQNGVIPLTNCTLSENTAVGSGGAIYFHTGRDITLLNCILWGNSPNEINIYSGKVSIDYCDVEGGLAGVIVGGYSPTLNWGPDNFDVDPNFVDEGDFHLVRDSVCMNAGNPDYVPAAEATDIDGQSRIRYGRVDIGADEVFQIGGDFEPDEDVDLVDFTFFARSWLSNCVEPDWCDNADINRSGVVDFGDLMIMAENWLD